MTFMGEFVVYEMDIPKLPDLDIHVEADVVTVNGFQIEFAQLKRRPDWSPQSGWMVPFFFTETQSIRRPINRMAMQFPSAVNFNCWMQFLRSHLPVTIYLNPHHSSFLDAIIYVYKSPTSKLTANVERTEAREPYSIGRRAYTPQIEISGPDAMSGAATFTLRYRDRHGVDRPADFVVHLSSNAGYLPKREIVMTRGFAEVDVMSLGLRPGDEITLNAGCRYVPDLGTKRIAIL